MRKCIRIVQLKYICHSRARLWCYVVQQFFGNHQLTKKSNELSGDSQLHLHHLGKELELHMAQHLFVYIDAIVSVIPRLRQRKSEGRTGAFFCEL